MLSKGELGADDVASMLKVSRRTLFRELRATRDREILSDVRITSRRLVLMESSTR
jgi:hypothetical protein